MTITEAERLEEVWAGEFGDAYTVRNADAYAAGHVLYDDVGHALTLNEFRALPGNKLGLNINYDLVHESGGTAAIDLIALLTSQRRGAGQCCFLFADNDSDFIRAMHQLRGLLLGGPVHLRLRPLPGAQPGAECERSHF